MKTSNLEWSNAFAMALFVSVLILLIISLTLLAQFHFNSVGWHDVASVGWVTVAS